jgi:hypothetical protein
LFTTGLRGAQHSNLRVLAGIVHWQIQILPPTSQPMHTESRTYLDYEIQVSSHPPGWLAAVYPTKPGMPTVDWAINRIWAANIHSAYTEAKCRIHEVLRASRPELPEIDDADREQSEPE